MEHTGLLQMQICNSPAAIHKYLSFYNLCNRDCRKTDNLGVVWRGRGPFM